IEMDVHGRRLCLEVSDAELAARKAAWQPPKRPFERGFGVMHQLHVTQANKGCDFDFLEEPVKSAAQPPQTPSGQTEQATGDAP
ncbi:dihydroxy-acid dehydratase, partial [Paraburkholderia sp. SIMBA_009]